MSQRHLRKVYKPMGRLMRRMAVTSVCAQMLKSYRTLSPVAWLHTHIQSWPITGGLEGLTPLPADQRLLARAIFWRTEWVKLWGIRFTS